MKGLSITAKLRYIITAACVAAILVTTGSLLTYQIVGYKNDVSKGLALRGRILAVNTTAALAFQNAGDAAEVLKAFNLDPAVTCSIIFDLEGTVFASYNHPRHLRDTIPFRQTAEVSYEFTHDTVTIWTPIEQQNKRLGTLAFTRSRADFNRRIRESTGIAFLVMLIAAGFAFWLSHVLQGVISLPLLKLTEVARRVTDKGDFDVAANVAADGEIGILNTAFSQMLQAVKQRDREIRKHAGELEKKVAQRTALLEQTNQDLKMFGDSVSHDLRSPLRSILGFSEMLTETEGDRLTEEGRNYLGRMQNNARKMEALIESLLRFSRLGRDALRKTSVDMPLLAKEVVEELRFQSRDRKVDVTIDPALPAAHADAALLRQVLANLIGNAFKFTKTKSNPEIVIGFTTTDGVNTYIIKDNGVGFDMQHSGKLFNVFERLHSERDFEGSGIGLATVHRILQRHGGRVWAEASPGQGATFYFTV